MEKLEDASRITAVALLISVILYLAVFIIGLSDSEQTRISPGRLKLNSAEAKWNSLRSVIISKP